MALMPNQDLQNLMFVVTGEWFPKTDEDVAALRSQVLEITKGKVDILKGRIEDSVAFVGQALPGEVGTNFIAAMDTIRPELDKLTDGMGEASGGMRKTAMDVREAKWNIIAELIRLAAEIAVLTALAAVTGGASATQIAVRKLIARVRMLVILYELSSRIPLFSAVTEAIEEALLTLATRLSLMRWAPEGQRPDGVDWRDVGIAAVFGALVGAFAEIFGAIVRKFTDGLNDFFDNWMKDPPGNKPGDDLGDNVINTPGGNRPDDLPDPGPDFDIRHHVVDEIGQAPSEGAAETLAEGVVNEIFYDGFKVGDWTALGAIVSRQFEMGLMSLGQGLGGALRNFFSFKSDLGTNAAGGFGGGPGGPVGGNGGFGGSPGDAVDGNGNGERGGLGGPLGNGGGGLGLRTETGGHGGLDGLNGLDGADGLDGPGGPTGLGGPGNVNGVNGLNGGPGNVNGLNGGNGLNSGNGLNGLNGVNGQGISPGPNASATNGLDEIRRHNQSNSINQFDGSGRPPRAGQSLGPDATTDTGRPGPGETAGNTGGRVPTSSQPHPDTAHEGQRQPGGAHRNQGQDHGEDQPRPPHADGRLDGESDQDQLAPRPETPTASQPEARPGSQPHAPASSQPPSSARPETSGEVPPPVQVDEVAPEPEAVTDASPDPTGADGVTDPARPPAVDALREQHSDAVKRLSDALDSVHDLRERVEAGVGTSRDAALLDQAMDDAVRAEQELAATEDRLREFGADPYTPPPGQGPAPAVDRDGVQRRWIADQVTADDLADGVHGLGLGVTVDQDTLNAAGITAPPELSAQWQLGGPDMPMPLAETGLSPVDRTRLLMLEPGPWPQALDVTAANTSRRLWQESYADFADSVARLDPREVAHLDLSEVAQLDRSEGEYTPSQAWSTATALVLPLEMHPARADSRHALGPYRDAVREVADLLVAGSGRDAAVSLADQLRDDLGLPPRTSDDLPPAADPASLPTAIPTASVDPAAPLPAAPAPRPAALVSAAPKPVPTSADADPQPVLPQPESAPESVPPVARAVPLVSSSSDTLVPPTPETAPGSAPDQRPEVLFAPPTTPAPLLAPRAPVDADPIRDWRRISAGPNRLRSDALRAVDDAVAGLPVDPGLDDVRSVLDAVRDWKRDKTPQSGRWEAITRLETAVVDRIDRIQQLSAPQPPAPVRPPATASEGGLPKPGSPVGRGPRPRPPVPPRRTSTMLSSGSQGRSMSLTPEAAQEVKFLRDKAELFHRINGIRPLSADPAFRKGINDFLANIERDRRSGTPTPVDHAAIKAIIEGFQQPGVYGHKIQYSWYHRHQDKEGFAEAVEAHANESAEHGGLWSKMGSAIPIQDASVGHGVVLEASIQGRIFDGLLFGLATWSSSPALGALWEQLSKTYALALRGWATVHVLDGTTDTSVLNRIEWPTLRGQVEAGKMDGLNVVVYKAVPNSATGGLDLVPVDTFPVRTQEEFDQLPKAPGDAAWFRKQTQVDREQRAALQEVYSREDELDQLDAHLTGLFSKHGPDLAFRPTLTPHTTFRDSFSKARPAHLPHLAELTELTVLEGRENLADLAVRLPVIHAAQRADLLTALSPAERRALAGNVDFVNSLQAHLSQQDFVATAARLMVDDPAAEDRVSPARQEAETIVAEMLADPDVAVSLLTGGRRVVVVPREEKLTSLEEFADLRGSVEGGRPVDLERALYHNGLIAIGEENLLGEPVDLPGAGIQTDGYGALRHELAHAIEEVLDPTAQQLIDDHYQAKIAEGENAKWPDGRGATYSASNPRDYFAQLTNTYLAVNAGTDLATGSARNNGADWVRENDPELLPLLERLYGPGRAGILGSQDNPYVLSGFRALFDRAEREVTPETGTPESGSQPPSPRTLPEPAPPRAPRGTRPARDQRPEVLFAPPTQAASRIPADVDPIRDWRRISAGPNRLRSDALRAVDDAVAGLPADPGLDDVRSVLDAVRDWKRDKTPQSGRWEAITRLETAVVDRIDRIQQLSAPQPPAPVSPPATESVAARSHPVEVEGFAPAGGFEVELHRYRLVLPAGHTFDQYTDLVSVPGLLKITVDRAGGVPVLELVTEPTRGLTNGRPDGRAERSDVVRAFRDVISRLENARPGSSLKTVFPAEAGYQVDVLAEDLPVRINEAGGDRLLVHHTASTPIAGAVRFLEHIAAKARKEPGPAATAHADLGAGLQFGAHGRTRFDFWLAQHPEHTADLRTWDRDELEGALALGFLQAAATVRGSLDRSRPPKDWTALASRGSLAGIRRGLGPVTRAFLEDQAEQLSDQFVSSFDVAELPDGFLVRDQLLPPRADGQARATVGQYLDNLLLETPERTVDQREALLLSRTWADLDGNPEGGTPRLEPPVAVVQVRLYASVDATPDTVETDADTLSGLSLGLYRNARSARGLPKPGSPVGRGPRPRPPVPPRRTSTMLSSGSQGRSMSLTPEAAQEVKFLRDKAELFHRINGIRPLSADPAFRKGINDFLANIERDRRSGTPTPVDHDAIGAIIRGFQQPGVYGHKIQYSWYHRHQDKEGFAEAVEAHASESAEHGALWSKMGSAIPIQDASVGHGVVLEASIQGRMFDGLLFGLSTWSSSPALGALWEQLSKTYALALRGWATVHVLDGTTDTSVLNRIEWPTLRGQVEAGKMDGLNVVVYKAVPNSATGGLDLVPVDTFPVRTQEEFDQLPKAPGDAAWFRKQTQVDREQRAALQEVYSREDELDQLDAHLTGLFSKHGPDLAFRPTLTPHTTFRRSFSSTSLTGRAVTSLVDRATRLPVMPAGERAVLLASLSADERTALSENVDFVNSLRAHLSQEDFVATAARLMVDDPAAEDRVSPARQEAEIIVAEMLADPDVAVSLLTGGRRVVVVPREVELTSLDEFAGLPQEVDGRSMNLQRALYYNGLIAIGEENLLGEPVDLPGAGIQADGYGALRHELAHAIEETLAPVDRELIENHYRAKVDAGESTRWPDGRGATYSASNPREYFAQLTNTYLAVNAGTDLATGSARNNGADWVRENDPELLPLLERLYGPGRAGILGSQDNPYVLSGFRALFDRAERELTPETGTPESGSQPPSPRTLPEPAPPRAPRGTRTTPGGRTLLAPPTQGGGRSRRLVEAMRQMFGRDIERHQEFRALYDALALVNGLHGADRRNRGRSFDVGATAERVLHLHPDHDVTPEDYRDLLLTVASADRRGWATSIDSIAAYQTQRTTGVLRPDTWTRDPYQGYTARNWSGNAGLRLDVSQTWAPGSRTGDPLVASPAPWGHRPHVVMAERDGDSHLIVLRDAAGNARYVDDAEFAVLVANDPDRPPNAPLLLLVQPPPNAHPETMPRSLAAAARVRVWSTDGEFSLPPAAGPAGISLITLVDRRPGRHIGIWFPSDPGQDSRSAGHEVRTTVGTVLDSSDVESYPLTTVDGRSLTGRAYLTSGDLALKEAALREASGVEFYANYDEGVPGAVPSRHGPMLPLPRALTDSYVLYLHGRAGWASVSTRGDGRQYNLPPGELGRTIRRRPSLRQLPDHLPVFALACELAQIRTGADRLVNPPEAQDLATQIGRTVFATDAQVTPVPTVRDSPPILVMSDDPVRPRYGIWEFRPEPDAETLRWIADVAGLPPDVSMRSTRALRWVLALREVFDIDIDSDPGRRPEFTSLVRDFGQLEMQRMATGTGEELTGPLTWRTLTQITGDFARRAGASDAVVTHQLLRDVLRAARNRTLRLPGMPNLPNILFAPPTQAGHPAPLVPPPGAEPRPAPSPALEPPPVRIATSSGATRQDPSPARSDVLSPDVSSSDIDEDSSDVSDMDIDSPRAGSPSRPVPVPADVEAAYRRTLTDALGTQITAEAVYPKMLAAVQRLDGLRRTSAEPALRDGPLDLAAVARAVLLLAPATPVRSAHYGDLFRIILDPAMENATGLAEPTAFGLSVRGALSQAGRLTAPDGTPYGRNWSQNQLRPGMVFDLDTTAVTVLEEDGTTRETDARPSPWRPRPGGPPPFVLVAAGNADAITVRLDDGTTVEASPEVVGELLAMDPVLSGLGRDVPLLLVIPYAGEGGLELPRGLADGLGRQVWSASGNVHVQVRADGRRLGISLLQEAAGPDRAAGPAGPKGHRGDWISSRPGEVSPDDGDDVPAWERRLVSFTIVSDEDGHPQLGRALLDADDMAMREPHARVVHRMDTLVRRLPGSGAPLEPLPIPGGAAPGEKVHHLVLHALPEGFAMPQEDGSTHLATPPETARWLRRRPSVQKLGRRDWLYLRACWAGRAYDGPLPSPATNVAAVLPRVRDSLADHPSAQRVSTLLRLRIKAGDRPLVLSAHMPNHPSPALVALTDSRGNDGQITDFWPEPEDGELARLARVAGLYTGPAPVSRQTLDTTLRLVHALRQGFQNPGIEEDPGYEALLRGVGALERMWRADPELGRMGQFTMELFRMLAQRELRDHGRGQARVDADTVRSLLARAAAAPAGTALTDFADLRALVETARDVRSLGPLRSTATGLLGLAPATVVREAHIQRVLWARHQARVWRDQLSDPDAVAVRALHLSAPDPARGADLLRLATRAFDAGRNPYVVDELAAFHLEELGAFDPSTRLAPAPGAPPGRPAGRAWAGRPAAGTHLDASALAVLEQQSDGSYHRAKEEAAPWSAEGMLPPYVVAVADAGSGRTWLDLPGGRLAVPNTEAAELISRDPDLIGRAVARTDVVLAVGPTGPAPGPTPSTPQLALRLEIAKATSREVWTAKGPSVLSASGTPGRLTVGSTSSAARMVPSAAADWSGTTPADTIPHRWAPPPAPPVTTSAPPPATLGITDTGGTVHGTPGRAPEQVRGRAESPVPEPVAAPERPDTTAEHRVLTSAPPVGGPGPAPSVTPGAPALSVRAAAPVRTVARQQLDFLDGRTQLDGAQRQHIAGLAKRLVTAALHDLGTGLRIPHTVITGYGDGARIAVGDGPAQPAEGAGRLPARAVGDALREAIRAELTFQPQEKLAVVRRVRGRDLTADDFPIDARGAEHPTPHPHPGVRRAVVEVQRSAQSRAVDHLKRLLPRLDPHSTARDALTLDQVADRMLLRPEGATAPPVPAPAAPSPDPARFDTDAVPDHLRPLYALVTDAMAAKEADSVESLAAFHLSRQGLFADATRLLAADGSPRGRNWTGRSGKLTDTTVRQRVPGSSRAKPSPTPWQTKPGSPEPYVIGTANGHEQAVLLTLPDGTSYRVPAEVFSHLVGMDPDLSAADVDTPVALVSWRAASMGLDLPRMTAFRSDRATYAHTGDVALMADSAGTGLRIEVSGSIDSQQDPLGEWALSEPDDWSLSERPGMAGDVLPTPDGRLVRMSDVEGVTLFIDGRPAGRMLMDRADQAERQNMGFNLAGFTEWTHVDPVTNRPLGADQPVPWKGRKPYVLWVHGLPGSAGVVADGKRLTLDAPRTAGYLKRRPSLSRLAPDAPLVVVMCWSDARPGIGPIGFSDEAPFTPDPWGVISYAQQLRNELDRDIFAPSRIHVSAKHSPKPLNGVFTTAMGVPGTFDKIEREPKPPELDQLALIAGLDRVTADPQDRRDTALRLVRGLRDLFGAEVEGDRADPDGEYQALLAGLGALEAMRRADTRHAAYGALTRDLVERIVRERSGNRPAAHTRPAPVDLADVRTVLRAAGKALEADASATLSGFAPLPSLDRALRLLAGKDADDRVRDVLPLAPNQPVGPSHRLHALWAIVKAVEAVDGHPDAESLARQVLHLRSYESVDLAEDGPALLRTAASAAAVGRDVHDPVALAAYHLAVHASTAPDTFLTSMSGRPAGRSWSSATLSNRFNTELYTTTDPTTHKKTSHLSPWAESATQTPYYKPYVLALEPGSEADTLSLPWSDQSTRSISYAEFAEMLRHDPAVRALAPDAARVVVVGLDGNSARKLADVLATRRALGRRVLTSQPSMSLKFDVQRGANYLDMATADADPARHWQTHRPEERPPGWPAPALPAPPTDPKAVLPTASTRPDADTEPLTRDGEPPAGRRGPRPVLTSSAPPPGPDSSPPGPRERGVGDDATAGNGSREPAPAVHAVRPTGDGVPHQWIESRLGEPGAERHVPRLAGADWAGGRTTVPLADLRTLGITLDNDEQAYATLMGGLPLASAGLSLVQRYRLLRAWSGDDAPAVLGIAADLAAATAQPSSGVVAEHGPNPRPAPPATAEGVGHPRPADPADPAADLVLESFPGLSLDTDGESEPDDDPRPLLSRDDDSDDDDPRPLLSRDDDSDDDDPRPLLSRDDDSDDDVPSHRPSRRPTGGPDDLSEPETDEVADETDEAADGLPAPAWALARIRYAQEALYFERRLAAHLGENPQINQEFAKVVRAFWTIALHNRVDYRRFGHHSGVNGGAVGTGYDALVRVVESGNLRERVTFLFNGVATNVVPRLMGGIEPQHPVIGIERRDRHRSEQLKRYEREVAELKEAELDPEDEAQEMEELEALLRTPLRPHEVWPALSPAERRLAVRDGVLLWSSAGQLYTLPMAADFQARSEDSGGLVLTGTSGSAYRIITHVARLNRLAGVPVDLGLIRSGLVSVMVGVGHHSFHEVMTGAQHALDEIDPAATTVYSDNWGRYWDVLPLTEEELRTYVAREGRFPDEHARDALTALRQQERSSGTDGGQRPGGTDRGQGGEA